MFNIKNEILYALKKHNYFIGLHQLCRFLNNKGFIRYGCNIGYMDDLTIKKRKTIKINPCKLLCNTNIYPSKLLYWIKKMYINKELFTILIKYQDSQNPFVETKKHKTFDIFRFISTNEIVFDNFKKNNSLERF